MATLNIQNKFKPMPIIPNTAQAYMMGTCRLVHK